MTQPHLSVHSRLLDPSSPFPQPCILRLDHAVDVEFAATSEGEVLRCVCSCLRLCGVSMSSVEIVGRARVVRSVDEARRSAEFISTFESILSKRRSAYEELAKGPDQ